MKSAQLPVRAYPRTAPDHDTKNIDLTQVKSGLSEATKKLPCKLFYDEAGSRLFEHICELPEYYLTRTELAIMQSHARDMAKWCGPGCRLVEYGSGAGVKIRLLLSELEDPAAYIPIDISKEILMSSAKKLTEEHPGLCIEPICADYLQPLTLPLTGAETRTVVYFPGSTFGNFSTKQQSWFLRQVANVAGIGGGLLIGIDLIKDPATLEAAYNDSGKVTALFNLNILQVINRLFGADFEPSRFVHRAVWDPEHNRMEMRLVSTSDQDVAVGGSTFSIRAGEHIVTEHSHKFTTTQMAHIAHAAGFEFEACWTDKDELFSVLAFNAVSTPY